MKVVLICVALFATLVAGSYMYVRSDIGLLSDETLLKIVSSDVLGGRLYEQTCPRSSYSNYVETAPGAEHTALFKFFPAPGMETKCPAVSVLMDRRTGEHGSGRGRPQDEPRTPAPNGALSLRRTVMLGQRLDKAMTVERSAVSRRL
jgi:hypothetical protein